MAGMRVVAPMAVIVLESMSASMVMTMALF